MTARVTGLQAALAGFVALLDAWRAQFSPEEFAVLLDLLARRLEYDLHREERPPLRGLANVYDREAV